MNRRLRFCEKVRYKWRRRKRVVRWVVLLLDVSWRQAAAAPTAREAGRRGERSPPHPSPTDRRKAA